MTSKTPHQTPGLALNDSMAIAGRKALRLNYAKMLTQQASVLENNNIEAVHDMRVAIRRMRVALKVFKPYFSREERKDHGKQLRAAGQILGPSRDIDVFLEKTHLYINEHSLEQQSLSGMIGFFRDARGRFHPEARNYLASQAYSDLKRGIEEFIENRGSNSGPSVKAKARPLIKKQLKKVRRFEQDWQQADYATLHRVRIAFKRLRYSIEFFQDVLGAEQHAAIDLLKEIQDHLGDLNDAHVALLLLEDIPETNKYPQTQAYFNYRMKERGDLIANFPAIWQGFVEGDFEANLSAALMQLKAE